jgi:NADH-quinone oxidoreductase subunit D
MAQPPTPALKEMCRNALPAILKLVEEGEGMLLKNRIFIDRLENVGNISGADAVALSWTGPCLRSTGVAYDVRKAHPYLKYDEVDFEMPVGTRGDNMDRFLVRLGEIRQSARIILQCCDRMPDDGPVNVDDPRVVLPPKQDVYTTIEATIQHFKLIMEGAKVPKGEVYSYTEGGNGELGFYLVSDGSGTPWRVRIRPPCFPITQGLSDLINGSMLSDIVPTFGSLNMIGGECDH